MTTSVLQTIDHFRSFVKDPCKGSTVGVDFVVDDIGGKLQPEQAWTVKLDELYGPSKSDSRERPFLYFDPAEQMSLR